MLRHHAEEPIPTESEEHSQEAQPPGEVSPIAEAAADRLIPLLARIRRRYRLYEWIRQIAITCIIGGALSWLSSQQASALVAITVIGFATVLIILAERASVSVLNAKLTRQELRELADMEDVRIIGPLLEALWQTSPKTADPVYEEIVAMLTRLLPRLKASDAGMLDAAQRNTLYAVMAMPIAQEPELPLAILKALEQIGDEKDLAHVERLAKGEGSARANDRIRQAAVECLPFLRARLQQQSEAQALLRPSALSDASPETLLRPAQNTPEPDPQQLLRAAPEDEK